jgi:hypothetical protein
MGLGLVEHRIGAHAEAVRPIKIADAGFFYLLLPRLPEDVN